MTKQAFCVNISITNVVLFEVFELFMLEKKMSIKTDDTFFQPTNVFQMWLKSVVQPTSNIVACRDKNALSQKAVFEFV